MLRATLNKSWKQHPKKHHLYGQLSPTSKTIQIRRTRHIGHCWRRKDELISGVLLWIPSHRHTSVGWLTRTYLQQLCTDTGRRLDLPETMNDRDEWRQRVKEIRASSATWWWWWWWILTHSMSSFLFFA